MTTDEMILELNLWADADPKNREWSVGRHFDEDMKQVYYYGEIFDHSDRSFGDVPSTNIQSAIETLLTMRDRLRRTSIDTGD